MLSVGAVLIYLGAVYYAVFRARGAERWAALVAYILNCAAGAAVVLVPNGIEDSSGDWIRLWIGLGIAVVSGGAVAYAALKTLSFRVLGAAVLGAGAFIGGLLFLLVFWLSVGATCLD